MTSLPVLAETCPSMDPVTRHSPPLPKKTQWDLLHQYVYTLSPHAVSPLPPCWMSTLDKSIFLALLAKLRSELELLRSEAQYSCHLDSTRNSRINPHNSSYTTPQSPLILPFQSTAPESTINSFPRSRASLCHARKLDTRGTEDAVMFHTLRVTLTQRKGDSEPLPDDNVSPLSPTFGPRRGSIMSGTLERRRSSVPFNTFNPPSPLETPTLAAQAVSAPAQSCFETGQLEANAFRINGCSNSATLMAIRNKDSRVIWEAMWTDIEKNLDEYVQRFEDEEAREGTVRSKEEIWREFVRLRGDMEHCLRSGEVARALRRDSVLASP